MKKKSILGFLLILAIAITLFPLAVAQTAQAAFDAYYGVLKSKVDEHGAGEMGVSYAALIDFDADGVPEMLFTTFSFGYYQDYENQSNWGSTYSYDVYGYTDRAVLLATGDIVNFGATSNSIAIAENSIGIKYLRYSWGDHGWAGDRFSTLKDGEWIDALYRSNIEIDDVNMPYTYYDDIFDVNGSVVDKEEYENAYDRLGIVITNWVDNHGNDSQTVTNLLAVLEGGIVTTPPPPPAKPQTLRPTRTTLIVNGEAKALDAYIVSGSNYMKLRDLAFVLNGTEKQFEVGYDSATRVVTITTGEAYTPNGRELIPGDGNAKNVIPTPFTIYLDGIELDFVVYNIGGSNFFKLRELMEAIDVYTDYDSAERAATLDTSRGYDAG